MCKSQKFFMIFNRFNKIFQNRIFKVGSMSLLATILTRAINLISVPVFSRILNTSEYGRVEVFMTHVSIFTIVLGLDFHGTVGKGRLDHSDDEDGFLCSGILLTSIAAAIIVAVINIFFGYLQGIFRLERWLVNIMLLYSYAIFLMSYRSADYNFFYEYKKNMRMTVTVAVLNFVLSLVFVKVFFDNAHVLGRVLGATIPTAICGAIVYIGYIRRGYMTFKHSYNSYFWKFGVPLIPHNLSHIVLSSSDKVMIDGMISSAASGIYSLSYTLGMMIQVVSEALNQVFLPWLYRKLQVEEHQQVRKVQKMYLLVYCLAVFPVLSVSPEIVKVIGDRDYWDGTNIILWIVFATFLNFTYTLYVNIEFFYRKTALISLGTFMAAIINVSLNILFLKEYGYYFAAVSTVISYGALLLFHAIIVNYALKIKLVDGLFLFSVVLLVFGVTGLLQLFLDSIIIRIFIGMIFECISAVVLFIMYKRTDSNFLT
ncbi:hypothetical protein CSX01_10035 [Pseudobutyrivibrio ruminis]|uniref:Polysaccharide biosynthesis protein C-terminal domain-containing protein n=2 Tax=Pseudobutyrivibrio ruminis TaxID=46206 RepID=A0A2G3DU96_9FIRM|nr:hypothetical protein CSX01_10035 [Pseudobutyrivibrio ruminis]